MRAHSSKEDMLRPEAAEKLDGLRRLAGQRGIEFILTSALRTQDEQTALFAQGRKTLRGVNALRKTAGLPPIEENENRIVTYSLTSPHQSGLAFDIAVVKDGVPVWSGPEYEILGGIGESIGLTWGGRWKMRDMCHFEMKTDSGEGA